MTVKIVWHQNLSISVGCVVGALGLYTSELEEALHSWGWSYTLGWVGVGLYAGGAVVVTCLVRGV